MWCGGGGGGGVVFLPIIRPPQLKLFLVVGWVVAIVTLNVQSKNEQKGTEIYCTTFPH